MTCETPTWKGKIKESAVGSKLVEWAEDNLIQHFTSSDKVLPNTDGPRYRMDFYYDLDQYFVAVECDENEHAFLSYPPRCELVRQYRLALMRGIPAVFVRYNPDGFKIGGVIARLSKEQRESILLPVLQHWFSSTMKPTSFITTVYICYSQAGGRLHGESWDYVCTQTFATEVDYEQYV